MTFKKKSQMNWGELVNFDAMDAIFSACAELEAQDKPINRESVKALSGVGFTTQLAAGIALYKGRTSLTQQFENTPEILAHAVCQAFETALNQYDSKLEEKLDTERDLFVVSLNQTTEEYETLLLKNKSQEQSLADINSKLSVITRERDDLLAKVEQQDKSFAEQTQHQQQISWKLQQSQQQVVDLKNEKRGLLFQHTEQVNSLKQEAAEFLQRSAGVAEKEQNRLMRLIAQDRDEHNRAMKVSSAKISELEEHLQTYRQTELDKERSLAKALEQVEASRNRETTLRREIEKLESKLLMLEERAIRTEAEAIQGALEGMMAQLKAEFRKSPESATP